MVDILHRVGVQSSQQAVYEALTSRDGLAGWWTTDTRVENQARGPIHFRFHVDGREIGHFEMKVIEQRPATRVLWQVVDGPAEWVGTQIGFELKQEGEWCIVMFRHTGWREPVEFMHHCSTKWALFLMSLKSLLENGRGAPHPHDVKIDNWN